MCLKSKCKCYGLIISMIKFMNNVTNLLLTIEFNKSCSIKQCTVVL